MQKLKLWERFKKYVCYSPELEIMLDISRMNFPEDFLQEMDPRMQNAYSEMQNLESGAIANPFEKRMVGHYWLRNTSLAPTLEIGEAISNTINDLKKFASEIHSGMISPPAAPRFTRFLVIGIGGSALGPQFVADALGRQADKMKPYFLDNTDPDGMDRVFSELGDSLSETLTIVISKSGGTKETRNGMLEAQEYYKLHGLSFPQQAVAVTADGSELDWIAINEGWLKRFPMWEWVGGRTSVTSAVGLLPASLQGFDIDDLLLGARICDQLTRNRQTRQNPSALLALMWYYATEGHGTRDMIIIPYKDRLHLFSRYLQQLIMESLGKRYDLEGNEVNQGITVYGNKGSTDQHAYVQQLRDGLNNFFVTFIEVLRHRNGKSILVEDRATSGDFLSGFLHGTRDALFENNRESITLTVQSIDAKTIGAIIALYERAVGFYASLINVNAYNQPGVEAGKKAASDVLKLQQKIISFLNSNSQDTALSVEKIAAAIGHTDDVETIFKILLQSAVNQDHHIAMEKEDAIYNSRFR